MLRCSLLPAALALVAVVDGRSIESKRQVIGTVATATGWTSLGCWSDTVQSRTLSLFQHAGGDVTDLLCQTQCGLAGYAYAGTEYGGQCFCGSYVNALSVQKPATDCNMACTGDATQVCGAGNRINLFWNGVATTNPGVDGWTSQGCWTDSVGSRSLTHAVRPLGGAKNNTVDNCIDACSTAGYTLAGAEYSGECFCDNTYHSGGLATDQTTCNMACKGNVTELCGGPNRLNLYSLGGVAPVPFAAPVPTTSSSSSVVESTTSTTTSTSSTSISSTTSTTSTSTDSTTSTTTSSTTSTTSSTTTSTTSSSSTSSSVTDAPSPPTVSDSAPTPTDPTTTTPSSTSTTPATSTAAPTPLPSSLSSWTYKGCYIDNNNDAGRLLPLQQADSTTLTIESCVSSCAALGYAVAGVENGDECWCGSALASGATKASAGIAKSKCHTPCSGDAGESCGGPWFLEVYGYEAAA